MSCCFMGGFFSVYLEKIRIKFLGCPVVRTQTWRFLCGGPGPIPGQETKILQPMRLSTCPPPAPCQKKNSEKASNVLLSNVFLVPKCLICLNIGALESLLILSGPLPQPPSYFSPTHLALYMLKGVVWLCFPKTGFCRLYSAIGLTDHVPLLSVFPKN